MPDFRGGSRANTFARSPRNGDQAETVCPSSSTRKSSVPLSTRGASVPRDGNLVGRVAHNVHGQLEGLCLGEMFAHPGGHFGSDVRG